MTAPESPRASRLGATVGGKVAGLVADAHAASRAKTMPTVARTVNSVIAEWFRVIDREAVQANAPWLRQVAEHPDLPPELRPMMRAAAQPSGQWHAALARDVAGQATSVGVLGLLENLLTPVTSAIIRQFPNGRLDAGSVAQAAERGWMDDSEAAREAAEQGINGHRFAIMRGLASSKPPIEVTMQMLRRGIIDPGKAVRWFRDNGIAIDALDELMAMRRVVLTPSEAAEMWNRSIVTTEEGRRIAAQSGVDAEDFDRLTELGGMPLSPAELGEAFRRGFIDSARFNRGIVQGPIRNEWFDVVERLQFHRMSPQNAAQAVLQGKMSIEDGRRVAHENGLDADDFEMIVESTGQPPGISLMQEAWNRGIIGEQEFTEAFLEGNTKNRWIDVLKRTRFRVLPREQINLTYRHGGFTREQALERYRWIGISPEDSVAMLATEEQRALGSERDLTVATVRELLEGNAITEQDALDFYSAIGYPETSARLLVDVAAIRRKRRMDNLAVSRVRSRFTSFKIDESGAVTALDRIGVLPSERDSLIDTWRIEREVSIPRLTTSQIQRALKASLLGPQEAFDRLRQLGYTEDDAVILVRMIIGTGEEG